MKVCPDCERDPDPRGPSACFFCRELNRGDVPSPHVPWHVAGLYRAVNDYITALRCGHSDIDILKITLDGAVAVYHDAELAPELEGEGESE